MRLLSRSGELVLNGYRYQKQWPRDALFIVYNIRRHVSVVLAQYVVQLYIYII